MSAAAAKRTVLAAASVLALVAVCVVGPAGGARLGKGDRVAPTSPVNPHVTAATPSLVHVAWEAAQDDVGVAGYYVYGDTGRAIVASPAYVVTSLGCGESSAVALVAFDRAGNRSPRVSTTVATAACPDTQPPTTPVGFRQAATTQNALVLAWNPSADNVGTVGYGIYRNVARIATSAEPTVTLSGLSCGNTYAYAVDATDSAGNRSALASVYVQTAACADGSPPGTPTNVAVTTRTPTSLALSWSSASDDVGVAGYRVSVDGSPATTVTETSATVSSLVCDRSYSLGVDAFDAAGNRSPAAVLTARTDACTAPPPPTGDTTPPSTPAGLLSSNVTQTGLTLAWSAATDNVAVTGYDIYRDGAKVASVGATTVAQSGLSCGTAYVFGVVARDAAGNASPAAQLNAVTAACSAPPPPSSDTTAPSQPANFRITSSTGTSVSLAWNPSTDNVGVAGYRTYANGAAGATTTQTSATVSSLTCGTAYTFEVDAYDAAGNRSTKASVVGSTAPCADSQPPSAPLNVVAGTRTATSIALSWSASSDNVGVTGYGLYRGGVQVGTSATASGIFPGLTCNTNYTLAVDAQDAAGNRSPKTTVMVATMGCPDTTPPSAPAGLAATSVTQTSLTLTWTASTDNLGVSGYDVYRGGTKMTTVTSTSDAQTGLSCGTAYSFGVVARDAAGNSSPQATLQPSTSACPPASEWTFCANEGQQCSFTGAKDVRYGATATYTAPRTLTDGVMCSNSVFGDPLPGVTKRCETRPASSNPSPPPSSSWSPPITITQGGTYSGSWSSDSDLPAVTIATDQPVIIRDSRIRNTAGGDLIKGVNYQVRDLTVERSFLYGGTGRVFDIEGFQQITVRNCTIDKTSGMKLSRERPGATVVVTRNKQRNIQGPAGYLSAFFKVAEVQNATIEVSWNEIVNEYGNSHPEDIISLFKSANAKVHNNYMQHSSTPGNAYNTSSQGTITLDYPDGVGPIPHDNEIYDNQMVDTVNGVHVPVRAYNNSIHGNRLIQDGKLPDGTQMGNGYAGWSILDGAGANNHMHGNVSGFVNRDGIRHDWFEQFAAHEGRAAEIANNTTLSGPITSAMEQAEWTGWQAKLAANGVTVGA